MTAFPGLKIHTAESLTPSSVLLEGFEGWEGRADPHSPVAAD